MSEPQYKKYQKYILVSEETGKLIDWRQSKQEAIRATYDWIRKYGQIKVIKTATGQVVYKSWKK